MGGTKRFAWIVVCVCVCLLVSTRIAGAGDDHAYPPDAVRLSPVPDSAALPPPPTGGWSGALSDADEAPAAPPAPTAPVGNRIAGAAADALVEPPSVDAPPAAPVVVLDEAVPANDDAPAGPASAAPRVLRVVRSAAPAVEIRPAVDCGVQRCGQWQVRLEGGMGCFGQPQGLVGPATGLANQMDWGRLEYDPAICGRLTIQYAPRPGLRVLLSGGWYGSRDASEAQTGVLGFSWTPGSPVLATPLNSATLESEAEFYGGEVHVWQEVGRTSCWAAELGAGVRVLRIDESASLDPWAAPFAGFAGTPYAAADVENTFFGGQVGGALHYDPRGPFRAFVSAKALMGGMNRDISIRDRSVFIGGAHAAEDEVTEFAWGADVEFGLQWQLSRTFAVGATYNLLYLRELVHATDALDFTQSATGAVQARQETDTIFVHMVFAGVTITL